MSEFTTFLPQELAELGLMAFADPSLADRLADALRGLPAGQLVDAPPPAPSSLALELCALAR